MTDLFEAPKEAKKPRGKAKSEVVEPVVETTTVEATVGALVEVTTANPIAIFTNDEQFSIFYQKLRAETAKHVADVTTNKGRDAIRSLARKVVTAKTSLDKAGLKLTEDARQTIKTVNASRSKMEEELASLAAEVRKPLTDWEAAEKTRVETNAATITAIRSDAVIAEDDTAATVEARGRALYEMTFEAPQWVDDEADRAIEERDNAIKLLFAARNRLAQAEKDAAELAELRKIAAERAAVAEAERIERERVEAEAAAQREAEAVEAQRIADAEAARKRAEEAEAARVAAAEAAAAAKAREEAEQAAQADRERIQREHDEAIEAANRRAAEIKAEAQAEAQRIADAHAAAIEAERAKAAEIERQREKERADAAAADAERDRIAAAAKTKREADEKESRERTENQEHRAKIKGAVKKAIMAAGGIDEAAAIKIVQAIVAKDIPHCEVQF